MGTIFVDNLEPQSGTSLTLGASGDTLTIPSGCTITNSGTANGFGKIGQVVQATTSSEVTNTSASYADTGLSASITPTSTSSKVLVLCSVSANMGTGGDIYMSSFFNILRGSTQITEYGNRVRSGAGGTSDESGASISLQYLDSPSTTSATTYKVQQRVETAGNSRSTVSQFNSKASNMILMEILD
tara:strand:- start:706 stop:1263 length:558 start_codon:yes stop_codon:yes gene_type:complete